MSAASGPAVALNAINSREQGPKSKFGLGSKEKQFNNTPVTNEDYIIPEYIPIAKRVNELYPVIHNSGDIPPHFISEYVAVITELKNVIDWALEKEILDRRRKNNIVITPYQPLKFNNAYRYLCTLLPLIKEQTNPFCFFTEGDSTKKLAVETKNDKYYILPYILFRSCNLLEKYTNKFDGRGYKQLPNESKFPNKQARTQYKNKNKSGLTAELLAKLAQLTKFVKVPAAGGGSVRSSNASSQGS